MKKQSRLYLFMCSIIIGALAFLIPYTSTATSDNTNLRVFSPKEQSTLKSKNVMLRWKNVKANYYEVAVGSDVALPNYGWYGDIKKSKVKIKNLPTDGSKIHVKIFAHFDDHIEEYTTWFVAKTQKIRPRRPTIQNPHKGAIITPPHFTLEWKNVNAHSYDIIVSKKWRAKPYLSITNLTNTSYTFDNLPIDNKKICFTVTAHFDKKDKKHRRCVKTTPPIPPAEPEPPVEPTPEPPPEADEPPVVETFGFNNITPQDQSVLNSDTLDLNWQHECGTTYDIAIGSSEGMPDYHWREGLTDTAYSVSALPTDGSKLHVRIFAYCPNKVVDIDLTYTAATLESTPNPTPEPTPEPPPVTPPPTPEPPTPATPPVTAGTLSAIWANTGEDKVTQHDLRASTGESVANSVWTENSINLFGAKNEVVSANIILESQNTASNNISVSFDTLTHTNGHTIASHPTTQNNLFNWVNKPIELFFVKYLKIEGVSKFLGSGIAYSNGKGQLPTRWQGDSWTDRPDHDTYYPDIAVPIELHPTFHIAKNANQSIWTDIYIPKNSPAGIYTGNITIKQNNTVIKTIPVRLDVKNFTLPDEPSAKSMLFLGTDINDRYIGEPAIWTQEGQNNIRDLRDTHFLLAHRHKISLIDSDPTKKSDEIQDAPSADWLPRLDGSLFSSANGYDGPGVNTPNDIYSIGTYGSWEWKDEGRAGMWTHTDNWANWFKYNASSTEHFLYLIDESSNTNQINTWANWININPGPGNTIMSMATIPLSEVHKTPELDLPVSGMFLGDPAIWEPQAQALHAAPDKDYFMYNGGRPGTGSWVTEDDGIALRQLAWAQYKKDISRWFYWESTYYNNFQGGTGQTDVFNSAFTFGAPLGFDNYLGQSGWNYNNGDGVLFYPGTDLKFSNSSYDIDGPIASLRLKYWRRGIQDVDYLTLAAQKNPEAVKQIVEKTVPHVLWEYGVDNPDDPTYVTTNITWSEDPDVWEGVREELAEIIEN